MLDELIKEATERLDGLITISPNGRGTYRDIGWTERDTAAGTVRCRVTRTEKHYSRRQHLRSTFYLNDRCIARAELRRRLEKRK
jgi:hypothetical protein